MRILVNYDKREQSHMSILQYHIKARNLQAIATNLPLSIGDLVAKAQQSGCQGILLCNESTLANCVPGKKPTLDSFRGSLLNFSVPTVVTNSLLHTTSLDHGTWLLQKDLDKFKTLSSAYKVPFSFEVLDNTFKMEEAYNELSSAICISYDIETKTTPPNEETLDAGKTFITCASWTGIYKDGSLVTYVLPLVDFLEDHWKSNEEYANALFYLRKINSLKISKVMHNGAYDCLHSIIYNAYPEQWTLDTMALMHSEFSSLPKTLDFVASITLPDYMQWKIESEEASRNKDIQGYWSYNAKDTWYTARILMHYLYHLPAYAKKNYAKQFPLVYPCLYSAFEGMKVYEEKRLFLRKEFQTQLDRSLSDLKTMFADENFNPGSYRHVQLYLYDIFGAADPHIGKKKDAKTGNKSSVSRGTDSKNLKSVGEQHPILLKITSAILDYRTAQKAISNYFDFYKLNGRLYWSLNPFGTETDRMSCSSSSLWCGAQIQNIPYYAKGMLIADDDFTLVEFDNSQSEARCTAYLSKETHLIERLEDPDKDFYSSLGTLFFGIPYEEVTKELRNSVLKKIVHGTNYMMGNKTFVENAGLKNLLSGAEILGIKISLDKKPPEGYMTPVQFAGFLLEAYHSPFPRVREWYKEIANEITSTHMLVSPLGHTRYFFGDVNKNHNILNGAVAHAPQNLSVQILNIGLMKVWKLTKESKGLIRFKAQIHDSIMVQVHNSILQDTILKIKDAMDNPVTVHGRTLRIPVDYKFGDSWGNMVEVKNKKE